MIVNGRHVDPSQYYDYKGDGRFQCRVEGCTSMVRNESKGKHLRAVHGEYFGLQDRTRKTGTRLTSISRSLLVSCFNSDPNKTVELEVS